MKIIYNSIIPFKGYLAINLFGTLFVRKEHKEKIDKTTINHESIHSEQIKEMWYIFFYIWYIIEWFIKIPCSWFYEQPLGRHISKVAYKSISFEQEAYYNEYDYNYLNNRKKFAWIKRLFKMFDYKLCYKK